MNLLLAPIRRLGVALVLSGLLLVSATDVAGQSKPVYLGTLTGIGEPLNPQPLSLACSNSILYIGTASGLYVYEVSNPAVPQFVASQDAFPAGGGIKRIVLKGSHAYLASVGLRIVDVSDPARPVTTGYVDNGNGGTNGLATDVAISGNHVYLANGFDGIRVYDVSNPYAPTNIGHWPNTPDVIGSFPQGIAVSGPYAYLANFGDGLRVFDISSPNLPVSVHAISEPRARGLAVEGDRLYLVSDTLSVYDISFPTKPVKLGEITDLPSSLDSVKVLGNYAYVGCSGYNFFGPYMYDVTNPTNIFRVSPRDDLLNDNLLRDMTISGGYAYLALQFGVSIYSLGEPSAPRLTVAESDARNLKLSWLAPSWRYRVEETVNPRGGNWIPSNLAAPKVNSGTNEVLVPRDLSNRFFRLVLDQ